MRKERKKDRKKEIKSEQQKEAKRSKDPFVSLHFNKLLHHLKTI